MVNIFMTETTPDPLPDGYSWGALVTGVDNYRYVIRDSDGASELFRDDYNHTSYSKEQMDEFFDLAVLPLA